MVESNTSEPTLEVNWVKLTADEWDILLQCSKAPCHKSWMLSKSDFTTEGLNAVLRELELKGLLRMDPITKCFSATGAGIRIVWGILYEAGCL